MPLRSDSTVIVVVVTVGVEVAVAVGVVVAVGGVVTTAVGVVVAGVVTVHSNVTLLFRSSFVQLEWARQLSNIFFRAFNRSSS